MNWVATSSIKLAVELVWGKPLVGLLSDFLLWEDLGREGVFKSNILATSRRPADSDYLT